MPVNIFLSRTTESKVSTGIIFRLEILSSSAFFKFFFFWIPFKYIINQTRTEVQNYPNFSPLTVLSTCGVQRYHQWYAYYRLITADLDNILRSCFLIFCTYFNKRAKKHVIMVKYTANSILTISFLKIETFFFCYNLSTIIEGYFNFHRLFIY